MGHYYLRPPSLCTTVSCWTVRNASRVGTQTRGYTVCFALNGRQDAAPPIGQDWPRIFPDHGRGEGSRR